MEKKYNIESLDLEDSVPPNLLNVRRENESRFHNKEMEIEILDEDVIAELFENREFEIIKSKLIPLIDSNPENDKAILLLAEIELILKKYTEAKYWLSQIKEKDKINMKKINNINHYLETMEIIEEYKKMKKWPEAISELDKLISNWPENNHLLSNMAIMHYKNNDFKKSSHFWKRVIKFGKIPENNLEECFRALYNSKEYEQINNLILFQGIENIENIDIKRIYIRSLYNTKKIEKCIVLCKNLIKEEDYDIFEVRYLVSCLIKRGRISEAINYLLESLSYNINEFILYNRLIECYLRINKTEDADFLWIKLFSESEFDIDKFIITSELAICYNWKERYTSLIDKYGDNFKNEKIFYKLCKFFIKYGNISECIKYSENIENTNQKEDILNHIDSILMTTKTNIDDIYEKISNEEDVWITELVMKQILNEQRVKINIKNNNKNICCHLVSSSLNRGGAERQVLITAKEIQGRKFNCKLIVHKIDGKGNGETYQNDLDTTEIIELDVLKNKHINVEMDLITERYKQLLELLDGVIDRKVRELVLCFSIYKPTIIHAWQDETIITCSIAAAIVGIPILIGSARSSRPDKKTQLHTKNRPFLKNCYKLLLKEEWFKLNINSEAGRISYCEWLEIPEDRIEVIKNGIDFKKLKYKSNKKLIRAELEKIGIYKNNLVVGGLFRLEAGKRPDLWIDSLDLSIKKNDNIRGILVGGGKMKDSIEKEISRRNLDKYIKIIGEKQDVGGWLSMMDVFLMTSKSEGLPNVTIEAQAFGIPVVATDAGGVKETFLEGQTGLLSESDSPDVISNLILEMLEKSSDKRIRRLATRNAKKLFSVKAMTNKTKKMYKDCLDTMN